MKKASYKLIQAVLKNSASDDWHDAVTEWEVVDQEEDETMQSECVCGKEGLRYLFTIRDVENNNVLFPIGSKCIEKFGVAELTSEVNVKEEMFKLMHAIENGTYIELSSEWFSRKLLAYFFKNDVFKPNSYNNQDGEKDYDFLLKMFNQRKEPTFKQGKKIKALIILDIFPYLKSELLKRSD